MVIFLFRYLYVVLKSSLEISCTGIEPQASTKINAQRTTGERKIKEQERESFFYTHSPSLFILCLVLPASVKFLHLFPLSSALRRCKHHPSALFKSVGQHSALLTISTSRCGKEHVGLLASGGGLRVQLLFPSVLLSFCRELNKPPI